MDTKRQLLDISRRPENRTCIDCGASSPQWANTNHSIFFCLECSGIHRSLGVHHSFVRSITMDTWSNDQVTRLSIGGNQKCLDFFNTYHNVGSIHDKYTSKIAAWYKDKLTCELNGTEWIEPLENDHVDAAPTRLVDQVKSIGPMTDKQRSEQYFSQKGNINSARPDDLPPSQGGKYAGFGSSYQPEPEKTDDPMAILSKGWSFFSTTAMSALSETTKMALTASEAIGNKINEQVIEPTTKAVRDPEFQNNLTSNLLNVGAKIGNQIGAVGVVVGNQVAGAVRDGVDGIRDVLKDNSAPTYKSHVEERFYEGNNVTREDVYHETNETVDQEPANNDSWNEPAQHDSWDKPVEDKKSKDDDWGAEW